MTSHPGFSSSSERSLSLLAVFRNISQSQHLWRTRIRSSSDQHNRCKRKRSDPIANSQPCSSSTPTFKHAAENYGQNLREDISSIRLYQTMLKNSRILSMDEEVEQMFQCYW
ncbi:hypothetical protein Y032_0360g3442 [Ancylostoma ceylanicum]|uniref:Uncharacterized protein n=1 Tax=Ancylostoma ceylanicum TaxID=53326 RepID=A0A016RVJ8_9BILA|nr:hypothetical protein Y032_0360g3442 [Ancylostoma ceylanicum]